MKCRSKNDKNEVAKNPPVLFKLALAKMKKEEKLALLRSKDNKNEVAKKPPLKFVKLLLAKQKKGEKIAKERRRSKNIKNEVAKKQKAKKSIKRLSTTVFPAVVRKDCSAGRNSYGIIVRKASQVNINNEVATDMKTHELMK